MEIHVSSEAIRVRWLAEEAEIRARLGAPGVVTLEQMRALTGLEFFERIGSGELPSVPIGVTLDFIPVEWKKGRVVFQGTPRKEYYNPLGSVHGGYAATLLDSCLGCAVHSTLPKGTGYTTVELKVNYIRPLMEDTGPVRAEGKVVSAGRKIGIAEGRIHDTAGKLYAFATTTCLIFPL
jgi:uncharacterized protein (TIGR00369 family)